ncbi:hypothetical protein [Pontivivens ytuae]|uniref:Uncharacterized protein n=1 Tax=Pontivivens ytuae TaxID=2789856 RepID=A0A7S9LQM9_9RHOB|nr:hypothetical protein [Pontivivens ytuae]QPH53336.1 hypothetical protein I0K15_16315 [Pontivivens ytuae]
MRALPFESSGYDPEDAVITGWDDERRRRGTRRRRRDRYQQMSASALRRLRRRLRVRVRRITAALKAKSGESVALPYESTSGRRFGSPLE